MSTSAETRIAEKKRRLRAEAERRIREQAGRGERVSRNINVLHEEQMTVGQKMADRLADAAGSWSFILVFLGIVLLWIVVNAYWLAQPSWDPYPFILLNLILSMLAGLQAPVIMMSQNRQEAKDRIRSENDYELNLKAEMEIEQLHTKMDMLRETQWRQLVEMQQRQIALLEQQLEKLDRLRLSPVDGNPEVAT